MYLLYVWTFGQTPGSPAPPHYIWKMQFILSCQSPSTGSLIYARTINMHMHKCTVEALYQGHGDVKLRRHAPVHQSIAPYWQLSLLIKPPPSVRRPTASPADTVPSRCRRGVASCASVSSQFRKILHVFFFSSGWFLCLFGLFIRQPANLLL